MKAVSFSSNEQGFSLAEVMVASAILGVITMAMMSMTRNQMRAMNFMEDRMSMMTLRTEIKQQLLVEGVCKSTFLGMKVKDNPVPITIKSQNGLVLYSDSIPEKSRYDSLEIESLTLNNVDVPNNIGSGWVEVVAQTKRLRDGTGPKVLRPARARIRVQVDSARIIRSCDTGRVTALDCGQHPHGKVITNFIGKSPERVRKKDICIGGIWLLYEKIIDPAC
ncbi:MAG: prepilin-type N-terminal cleavage/methylation domain-containing protein [Bdellovibrionales bacterium]|nr:prepilin-type N-terminal cleavage/methylation domain-containing protein [Bdellovibrionales bacterium]